MILIWYILPIKDLQEECQVMLMHTLPILILVLWWAMPTVKKKLSMEMVHGISYLLPMMVITISVSRWT